MENRQALLKKYVLATVIYYDVLDYPLTAFETWKNLIRVDYHTDDFSEKNFSLTEVLAVLQDDYIRQFIETSNGFFFLKGRGKLVADRIVGEKNSADKFKKIFRYCSILRYLPYVRMIGITGGIAMKIAKRQSDLDFLVVLSSGRIWTGRTIITIASHLMGIRRHGKKIADRICLNAFITDASLEMATKDLFSANEYTFIYPIYGWEVFKKFQLKNGWIFPIKPSYLPMHIEPVRILGQGNHFLQSVKKMLESLFAANILENRLRKMQKKKIETNPKTAKTGSLIYANDGALLFFPEPHGPIIFEKFKNKIDTMRF